jgi:hypothetical protein
MKSVLQVLTLIICSFLQVLFLPINFALLFILFLVHKDGNRALFAFLVIGSFLVSIFGNLGFGLTLISFSLSVILFLSLRKFLPDNLVGRIVPFVVVLIFWEVLMRFELLMYTKLL